MPPDGWRGRLGGVDELDAEVGPVDDGCGLPALEPGPGADLRERAGCREPGVDQEVFGVDRDEGEVAAGGCARLGGGAAAEDFADRVPLGDADRPARGVGEEGVVADAEQVEDRRRQVLRLDLARVRIGADGVAGAEHLRRPDAGAGQREAEDVAPVVAAADAVDLGRAAELADRHDQRLVQQPALVEVVDQRGEGDVELRAEDVLQPVGVLGVRVPHRVIDRVVARLARPVDVDEPHPGLDQPPGEQDALAPLARP